MPWAPAWGEVLTTKYLATMPVFIIKLAVRKPIQPLSYG